MAALIILCVGVVLGLFALFFRRKKPARKAQQEGI
jgi:hypothetical protein